MNSLQSSRRHLNVRKVLDYLDSSMDAKGRQAVETHLGLPCKTCRSLVRELGLLIERMRLDRADEVPSSLHALALAVFEARPRRAPLSREGVGQVLLKFDSLALPPPLAAIRAVGNMRRVHYTLGSATLELESELESADTRSLRGRLEATDPELHRIEVSVGKERLTTRPDTEGAFVLDSIPLGRTRITVVGPRNRYRIPPIE